MNNENLDILDGFDTYAEVDEVADATVDDAPATTVPCSALASYTTAQLSC